MTRRLILSVITLCTVIACTTDAYESGDGTYSYMRADFAESYTNSQTQFFAADTDDNRHVEFQQAMAREWATTPDSVYRTLVYYSAQPDANSKCRLFSVVPVNVLRYKPVEEVKEMHTDPLYWNSIRLFSCNRINFIIQSMESSIKLQCLMIVRNLIS